MAKPKKKATTQEKLAKDRLRKKEKYAEIKKDPEKYRIQKEKERKKYLLRKEKKKIISIAEMTDRQKREQRRRWRQNSRKYLKKLQEQKKLQTILLENSPPESEAEEILNMADPAVHDPLMEIEEQAETTPNSVKSERLTQGTSSALRKLRYRSRKVISNLQKEINTLKKDNVLLKKQMYKERKMQKIRTCIEDTVEKKVNKVINDIKADKIEEVKKKLLFNETLSRGVSEKYKSLSKKEKRSFVEGVVDDTKLRKYGVLSKVNFALKKKLSEKKLREKKTAEIKQDVKSFLQEDVNSQVAPGKHDYVKVGSTRKQKRYLTDNIKNLHTKFCEKGHRVSYSVFCKYRPKETRDTCQCKLHANFELLIKSLNKSNIIIESTATKVLQNICCSIYDSKCLERKCQECKNKVTTYQEFDDSKTIVYYEWIFEKQAYRGKDEQEKFKRITLKKKKEDTPRNVINKFETLLIAFIKHTLNINVQYSAIKELKENLSVNEVLCHVDFSENYLLKYHEEIQSFHFGGSRQQVSLHTGVLYYKDSENKEKICKSFCTIAKNINHDASAIWAHLEPVLKMVQTLVPAVTTIHFLSDSPSNQYRNRFIFYMMTKLKEQIPNLKLISWNYQEAGHGKGAPDGIGAVVKRTADNYVRFGGDVATFDDFVQVVQQNIENVEIVVVAEEDISKKRFPKDVPAFKGTTRVHQAVWSSSLPFDVAMRSLSCFACRDSYVPCKHGKHLGVLNVGHCQEATAQSTLGYNNDNVVMRSIASSTDEITEAAHEPLDDNNSIHIDSPTIFNNIGDLTKFNLSAETLNPAINIANESRVTILSNIPVNYQRFKVHGRNSQGFSSIDQIEFEKFIQRPVLQNFEDGIEEFTIEPEFSRDRDTSNTMDCHVEVNKEKGDMEKLTIKSDFSCDRNKSNTKDCYDEANKENVKEIELMYDVADWVVVEYKTKKNSQYFVGKIIDKMLDTLEYKIIFLRKGQGKSVKFGWPLISDDDVVPESRILQRLEEPVESRRGQFSFKKLPNLNFKSLNEEQIKCSCKYKSKDNLEIPTWLPEHNDGKSFSPSYNISPSDVTPVLISNSKYKNVAKTVRVLKPMMWGIIPPWHKGEYKSHTLSTNNCRYENIINSKLYNPILRNGGRCVIIAEGFYEWQTTNKTSQIKQPYYIYPPKGSRQDEGNDTKLLFWLYSVWKKNETVVYAYSVITMESNDTLSWLHHRMPAILECDEQIQAWLDIENVEPDMALGYLKATKSLSWHKVAVLVNNARNKTEDCRKMLKEVQNKNTQKTLKNWFVKVEKRKSDDDIKSENKKPK